MKKISLYLAFAVFHFLTFSVQAEELPAPEVKPAAPAAPVLPDSIPVIEFSKKEIVEKGQVKLSFTGDLLVHEMLYKYVDATKAKDFSIIWKNIIPLFERADIAYLNLEGPAALGITRQRKDIGDIGVKYDKVVYSGTDMLFNYHPRIIDDILSSHIDIVSTANNHTFDRGSIGIDKTIDAMNEKGLRFVGTRKKDSKDPFYTIINKNNIAVAWISCSEMTNGFKDNYSQILYCYDQADEIVKMIKDLKDNKKADAVIVAPHWGVEYQHLPNSNQKKYARLFLDAGAIAIIGAHPHVLQPAEKYITKDGRETFIAYSLGNFVAGQKDLARKASAVIYLDLVKTMTGDVIIKNYSYEPTVRESTNIYHANKMKDVLKHEELFFGKYKGQ